MNNCSNEHLICLHTASQWTEESDQISNAFAYISHYSEIIFQHTGLKLITDCTSHVTQTNWITLASKLKHPCDTIFFKNSWIPVFSNSLDYFIDLSSCKFPLYEIGFDYFYEDPNKFHWRKFICYNSIFDFILDIEKSDQNCIKERLNQALAFMNSIGSLTDDELKKEWQNKLTYNAKHLNKVIMYIVIIIVVIVLLVVVLSKNSKADQTLKEVAKYDDQTLTPAEKNVADMLFQVVNHAKTNEYENSDASFYAAIDEIAMEIFKSAMWRLNDKKLANHYFQNQGYVIVCKQKIINNFFRIYNDSGYSYVIFNRKSGVQQFALQWILKIRDETKNINQFLG